MKRALAVLSVLSLLVFAASLSFAAEKENLWTTLKNKVSTMTPTKTVTTTTAVGGLRGAKDGGETLYWKGKDTTIEVTREELDNFSIALDYASKGEKMEARKRFEDFLKKYPSSALAKDAKDSLQMLKE
ncbi:MAG: hypothetical protein Q8J64_10415 [Thermodesulfovibrionales bacterium]|nr:hypothetical protein [Thermodesulfovibrionales bacterium]